MDDAEMQVVLPGQAALTVAEMLAERDELRAENARLRAAYSPLLRAAEALRPFADEFRFPSGRIDVRVAEACRGVIAALDASGEPTDG